MTKKILLSFLLFAFAAGPIFAQNRSKGKGLHIEWSKTKKSKTRPTCFLGENSDGNYIFLATRASFVPLPFVTILTFKDVVRVYDRNFQHKEDKKLESPAQRSTFVSIFGFTSYSIPEPRIAVNINGGQYLVLEKDNKKKGTDVYVQKIDIDNYALGDQQELFSYNTSSKDQADGRVANTLSPNNKSVVFYHALKAGSKKSSKKKKKGASKNGNKVEYKYYVVNENVELASEGKMLSEREGHNSSLNKVLVNDAGSVLFIFNQVELKKKKKKSEGPQTHRQFILKAKDQDAEELELEDINKDDIESVSSKVMPDNTFMLFGTVRGKEKKIKEKMFIYQFNDEGEVVSKTLPEGYQSEDMSAPRDTDNDEGDDEEEGKKSRKASKNAKKTTKKSSKGDAGSLSTLLLRDIIMLADSSYYIICENYNHYSYTTTTTTRGANGSSTTTTKTYYVYQYGNLELYKFTAGNEFDWQKTVYRYNQYTFGFPMPDPYITGPNLTNEFKSYFTFCYVNRGDALHIFFGDREDNTKNSPYKDNKVVLNSVMHVSVNPGGAVKKDLLSSKAKDKEHAMPNFVSTQMITRDKMVFIAYKGLTQKKAKAGIVDFN